MATEDMKIEHQNLVKKEHLPYKFELPALQSNKPMQEIDLYFAMEKSLCKAASDLGLIQCFQVVMNAEEIMKLLNLAEITH